MVVDTYWLLVAGVGSGDCSAVNEGHKAKEENKEGDRLELHCEVFGRKPSFVAKM